MNSALMRSSVRLVLSVSGEATVPHLLLPYGRRIILVPILRSVPRERTKGNVVDGTVQTADVLLVDGEMNFLTAFNVEGRCDSRDSRVVCVVHYPRQ